MKALEELHAVGFEPKVLITVTKIGLPDLEKLLSLLIEKGVTRVNISPLRRIGRADGQAELCVRSAETRRAVRQVRKRCLPDQPPLVDPPKPGRLSNCGAAFA
jgi:MoaA/NifB/PqqE/SkfB family radical SAM enzyme